EVTYESLADDGADAIGGLANEGTYRLVATDANSFRLEDEATGKAISFGDPGGPATQALAYIGEVKSFNPTTAVDSTSNTIAIDATDLNNGDPLIYNTDQDYSKTLSTAFTLDAIDATAFTINLTGSGFANGDSIRYNANGNTAITGLTDGATYTAVNVNGDRFQLRDANGNIVQVAQGNALGMQTFTDNTQGTATSVNLARIDTTTNRIYVANHGFTGTSADPQLVDYSAFGGATAIGG